MYECDENGFMELNISPRLLVSSIPSKLARRASRTARIVGTLSVLDQWAWEAPDKDGWNWIRPERKRLASDRSSSWVDIPCRRSKGEIFPELRHGCLIENLIKYTHGILEFCQIFTDSIPMMLELLEKQYLDNKSFIFTDRTNHEAGIHCTCTQIRTSMYIAHIQFSVGIYSWIGFVIYSPCWIVDFQTDLQECLETCH